MYYFLFFKIVQMVESVYNAFPLFHPSLGEEIILVATMCFITIISTSIYLHRCKTHKAVILDWKAEFYFLLIIWLNNGIKAIEWVVFHVYHHANSDKKGDPHSPKIPIKIFGWEVKGPLVPLLEYFYLYGNVPPEIKKRVDAMVKKENWIFRNLFHRLSIIGPIVLLTVYLFLFGLDGIWMFAIQFFYMPIVAGMGINGFGHGKNVVDEKTRDYSADIFGFLQKLPKSIYWTFFPVWALLKIILSTITGGEYLHHFHHLHQASAKIAGGKWEFDISWLVIYVLWVFDLAKEVYYFKDGKRVHLGGG
ncbi:MAG: hypothetical protein V4439_00480 [Patescibacteria group bacterium]